MVKSEFLKEFKERGYFFQCTDENSLDELFAKESVTAYIGFDCTANSLHVGSLVQIMIFRLLQKHGHKPIVLMGGGTTRIGDPSGKDEARKLLSDEDIVNNMEGIKNVIAKFVKFGEGKADAIMLNNADWLSDIKYIDFLRDYGRHFSVNRMLTFDSVKLRLEREQNLSFLEFNYMLLQGYDFVELYKRYGCRVELGGSDQWGNIVSGIDLGRRLGTKELFGITTSLITTASGAKMGKSANGAVWLSAEHLSPYNYFQFWRNTEDQDVGRFLRLFTDLSIDEIKELEKLQGSKINEAKKILAFEATKICHGEEEAIKAREAAQKLFEQNSLSDDMPIYELTSEEINSGIKIFELFTKAGLTDSNGEAKRLIKGNGGKLNDITVNDENLIIKESDFKNGSLKLSSGKKKHVLVKILLS